MNVVSSAYFENPLEVTLFTTILALIVAYIFDSNGERAQIKIEIERLREERERSRRAALFPKVSNGNEIARMTVAELMNAMRSNQLKCEDIVRTFCSRALYVGQNANATTEELFESAIERAREIDLMRSKSNHDVSKEPPLLGLPISVKDQYDMEGCYSDMGLGTRLLKGRCKKNGVLIGILKRAGAIFFTRSNVPQGLLVAESNNLIWGESKNPHDLNRTPGGSSGGEGCLIGGLASPVGLGSDIGGSIRIPAHNNGVYGFKPTAGRITSKGLSVPRIRDASGFEGIKSTAGPLGKCTNDLIEIMRVWLCDEMFDADPFVPRLPLNMPLRTRKLRVGFLKSDPFFDASMPCQRAVVEAANAMKSRGHDVFEIKSFPSMKESFLIYARLMGADAMTSIKMACESEPLIKAYNTMYVGSKIPRSIRPFLAWILRCGGQFRTSEIVAALGEKTIYEFYEAVIDRKNYEANYLRCWKEENLDVLITPGGALPALPLGAFRDLFPSFVYTTHFNLLNYPTGTVPVTQVRKDESNKYQSSHGDMLDHFALKAMQDSAGMPIGVQVTALPFQDEIALHAMQEIEFALGRPFQLSKLAKRFEEQ